MMKKWIVISLLAYASHSLATTFPTCPDVNTAAAALNKVTAVTQSTLSSGYQLSQAAASKSGNISSAYNLYSQTPLTSSDAVETIHKIAGFLSKPATTINYSNATTNFQQCVYWGSMQAGGTPTGSDVLSIEYSQSKASSPLTLTATQALPAIVLQKQTYTVDYQLNNSNSAPQSYELTPISAAGVSFVTPSADACKLNAQASLAAQAHCNIALQFDPKKLPVGTYQQTVLKLAADVGVTPTELTLKAQVSDMFAQNVIIFGDSLSDLCDHATNNDPTLGYKMWPNYFVSQVKLGARGIVCSRNLPAGQSPANTNVDYAVGGAVTADIPGQINNLVTDLKGAALNPNAKVIIWIGGNDVIGGTPSVEKLQQAVNLLGQIITSTLPKVGVKPSQVILINLPNTGLAPAHAGSTKWAVDFNDYLVGMVKSFPMNDRPQLWDSFQHEMGLITYLLNKKHVPDPAYDKYGFDISKLDKACKSSESGSTAACQGYISWDGTHPTVMGHWFLADAFTGQA